ncbi:MULTISPECIES: ATPase [unclassified Arsukibacterium]|jgi:hypothetical protein|uniref:ATPase n=1 Tax=unclassified Arsukibacterium TaxID=2635278 RepID=UPI000C3EFABC|nr:MULTISPECIES: ATPase [unclassified Arsukibacterium]MAA96245.1 hypothetical protein [Rheinheimera sp.]MBM33860.1 hypothetical protein [Rheinheimera sp.]HAW92499.1 hypothetical protein [Candidatus Azambacteria bacterium]|tara:strand:+ start:1404 stop:1859 length:456 start_codon:yes stop_codon:yes gene_type:complete
MKIESMRDILHWTVQFHEQLANCLEHCAPTQSERSKMVMQYLLTHEKHLAVLVKSFSDKAQFGELETLFIEYLEKNPIVLHEHCDGEFANLTEAEISARVIDQHQQVLALYSYLKEQAAIPHHKELMNNLLELENQEIILMAQGLNRFQDM